MRHHGVIAILGKLIGLLSLGNLKSVPTGLHSIEIGLRRSHIGGGLSDMHVEKGVRKYNYSEGCGSTTRDLRRKLARREWPTMHARCSQSTIYLEPYTQA